MQIKYIFIRSGRDKNDIRDITLNQEIAPRIGELANFNVVISDEESFNYNGRVTDVEWYISGDSQYAVVFVA